MLKRGLYRFAFSKFLSQIPSYSLALNHYMNQNFQVCAEYLKESKQHVEDPSQLVELLTLLAEVQGHLNNPEELLATYEQLLFSSLSSNSIYSDPQHSALKQVLRAYIKYRQPERFSAIIEMSDEMKLPLVYENELLVFKGIFALWQCDYGMASILLKQAIDSGVKRRGQASAQNNLGFAQVNLAMVAAEQNDLSQYNILLKNAQLNFSEAIMNNEYQVLELGSKSIEESKGTKELQTLSLNSLIEITNSNSFRAQDAIKHIDRISIHSAETLRMVMNLTDCLQRQGEYGLKRSMAWTKVALKATENGQEYSIIGRALLQLSRAELMDGNTDFSEKVILDVLEGNEGNTYLQMIGLQQYSDMLKLQGRFYESDEYLQQALNISNNIPQSSHFSEYVALL